MYRHIERRGIGANRRKNMEKISVLQANRRSFDCASRDETARDSAQDDTFYILQSLSISFNHLSSSYMSIHPSSLVTRRLVVND